MPSPEKLEFFKAHQDTIQEIVIRENARRTAKGYDVVSPDEMDEALGDIMDLVESGGRITTYRFKEPQGPKKEKIEDKSQFSFEITPCSNGFLLNVSGKKKAQFIFKTQDELMMIFQKLLFKKTVKSGRQDKLSRNAA